MVYVRELDDEPIEDQILILRKIAIQRQNLINSDFNRSISQYQEIKPLQSLYKPILDSMTGIFQQVSNFELSRNLGIRFKEEGVLAFVDDLSSKSIRSSIAIAQALNEVSVNGPVVGQPRANYARELAKAFARRNNDEMTIEEIIETIARAGEPEPPSRRNISAAISLPDTEADVLPDDDTEEFDPLDLTSIDRASRSSSASSDKESAPFAPDLPRRRRDRKGDASESLASAVAETSDTKYLSIGGDRSSVPVDAVVNDKGAKTKRTFEQVFGSDDYFGNYAQPKTIPKDIDPLRIYRTGSLQDPKIFLLGTQISKKDFKDGKIKLYGREVPLSTDLLTLLKNPAGRLGGLKSSDKNTGAIVSWAYKNNPLAFEATKNIQKRKYIEDPYIGGEVFGSGVKKPAKSAKKPGGMKLVTIKEAINKFKLLLGELRSGNNSKILLKDLKGVSDLLYKEGKLTKNSNIKIQKL